MNTMVAQNSASSLADSTIYLVLKRIPCSYAGTNMCLVLNPRPWFCFKFHFNSFYEHSIGYSNGSTQTVFYFEIQVKTAHTLHCGRPMAYKDTLKLDLLVMWAVVYILKKSGGSHKNSKTIHPIPIDV